MKAKRNDSDEVIVRYVNHASFLIEYRETSLLIDPFFSGEFFWQGHREVQLKKPKIKLKNLPHVDAILCTHIHGDHFDKNAVFNLIRRDRCLLIAPFDVIGMCIKEGLKKSMAVVAVAGKSTRVKDANIIFLPNKGSERERKCIRFSFVIECGRKKIFHSGDSHGYSEMWNSYRGKINLACLWCVNTEEIIENLQPEKVVLHHFESFFPGDFSCNIEVSRVIETLQKKFTKVIFYNPIKQNTIVLE